MGYSKSQMIVDLNKSKKPIATKKQRMFVSLGSIEGFEILQDKNLKNIKSYEVIVTE